MFSRILAYRYIKTQLSKLKFALGLSPKVEKSGENYEKFLPNPYKAVCLISADLEMAWAFRWSKSANNPIELAEKNSIQTRNNVPLILKLSEQYNIPITWATVGHLFLESCERITNVAHPDVKRLPYFENTNWKYESGDWFDSDPCTNYYKNPAWYAPDLLKMIIENPVKHEIGCHTFSHIDCSDSICSKEAFDSEINKCKKLANEFDIELKSFVHPGFYIGHLNDLAEFGFTSYRTNYANELTFLRKNTSGLWEFRNTMELSWRVGWSVNYHIKRYKTIIDRAIKYHKVCVFWFHPSLNPEFVTKVMPEVFAYLQSKSEEIICLTHYDYTKWLESNGL